MSKAVGSSKAEKRREADKAIEALLHAIEGDEGGKQQPVKEGMTKAQQQRLAAAGKDPQHRQGGSGGGGGPPSGAPSNAAQLEEMKLNALRANYQEAQRRQLELIQSSVYVNEPQELQTKGWVQVSDTKYIRFEQFTGAEDQIDFFMDLFSRELSEPYSTFTHLYFIQGWPDLAIIAHGYEGDKAPDDSFVGEKIGGVVSKVSRKGPNHPLRSYVAMLAVEKHFRGAHIGRRLVVESVSLMKAKGCDYVYLETPTSNEQAMKLYTDLGFAKVKYLHRYYMDGKDAVRLKLWLKPPFEQPESGEPKDQGEKEVPAASAAAAA